MVSLPDVEVLVCSADHELVQRDDFIKGCQAVRFSMGFELSVALDPFIYGMFDIRLFVYRLWVHELS